MLSSTPMHPYLDCLPRDPVTPFWQPGLYLQALLKHSSARVAANPSAALYNDVIDNSSSCLLTWETSLQRHFLIVSLPSNRSHLPLRCCQTNPGFGTKEKLTEGTFIIKKILELTLREFYSGLLMPSLQGCFQEQNGFRVGGGN